MNSYIAHIRDVLDAIQEITLRLFGNNPELDEKPADALTNTTTRFEKFELARDLAIEFLGIYKDEDFDREISEFLINKGYIVKIN